MRTRWGPSPGPPPRGASDGEAGGSRRVCSRRGLSPGWEGPEGFQEEVLFKLGWREPGNAWGVSGPESSLPKPRGTGAHGVFLETTWFPGLLPGSARRGRAGGRGGGRAVAVATVGLATPESQQLLGGVGPPREVEGFPPDLGSRPPWSRRRGCRGRLVLGAGGGCRQALARSEPGSRQGQPRTLRTEGCQLILQLRTQAAAPPPRPPDSPPAHPLGLRPALVGGGRERLWGRL